jgi:hypothetical protein
MEKECLLAAREALMEEVRIHLVVLNREARQRHQYDWEVESVYRGTAGFEDD